jgi:hypothetical protein
MIIAPHIYEKLAVLKGIDAQVRPYLNNSITFSEDFSAWACTHSNGERTDSKPQRELYPLYLKMFYNMQPLNAFSMPRLQDLLSILAELSWVHWMKATFKPGAELRPSLTIAEGEQEVEHSGYLFTSPDGNVHNPIVHRGVTCAVFITFAGSMITIHSHTHSNRIAKSSDHVVYYQPSIVDLIAYSRRGWQIVVCASGLFVCKITGKYCAVLPEADQPPELDANGAPLVLITDETIDNFRLEFARHAILRPESIIQHAVPGMFVRFLKWRDLHAHRPTTTVT